MRCRCAALFTSTRLRCWGVAKLSREWRALCVLKQSQTRRKLLWIAAPTPIASIALVGGSRKLRAFAHSACALWPSYAGFRLMARSLRLRWGLDVERMKSIIALHVKALSTLQILWCNSESKISLIAGFLADVKFAALYVFTPPVCTSRIEVSGRQAQNGLAQPAKPFFHGS